MKPYQYHYGPDVLSVENVSLAFRDEDTGHEKLILRNITFKVQDIISDDDGAGPKGQIIGILGESGIGKTQLLMMLAGLLQPTTGRILVNTVQTPVKRGEVGVVFQNYPLFEHESVVDNLLLAGRKHGYSKSASKAKAYEWLEKLGLTNQAESYPALLSGGQRQRIAIAQQLICSDHYILFDEPFSGLDLIMCSKIIRMITDIASADELNTFIVITHDLSAAVKACDRLILIGHERTKAGELIPGATIRADLNLIDAGLAWHPEIELTDEYALYVRDLKRTFAELSSKK